MKQVFEGHNQARQFAEQESRKQKTELAVVITKDDGIKYVVVDLVDKYKLNGKVMDRYKNGEIFNGELIPDLILPPKIFIPPTPPPLPKVESEKIKEEAPIVEEEIVAPLTENPSEETDKAAKIKKKKTDK